MPDPELSPVQVNPPSEYRVSARARAGATGVADVGTGSIDIDTTWGSASSGDPGPAELLAAALAACLLKNLARARDLLGFQYDDAAVEVTARRQDRPPRFTEIRYTVRITTGEPRRRVDLVHLNLRKFGTVYNTLAAVCDVDGEVLAHPAIALAQEVPAHPGRASSASTSATGG